MKVEEDLDDVFKSVDPEEVFVKVLASPMKPSAKEVEAHNATHMPYRNWCPVCVKSRGKESPTMEGWGRRKANR